MVDSLPMSLPPEQKKMKGREECKMLGEGVTSLSGSSPDMDQ
jgi:hypothetical protein